MLIKLDFNDGEVDVKINVEDFDQENIVNVFIVQKDLQKDLFLVVDDLVKIEIEEVKIEKDLHSYFDV